MAKRISIGDKVTLLLKDNVALEEVSTFFIIAHGTKVEGSFVAGMSAYFPWGIDNYGWYESDTGFPLKEIYRCYRLGTHVGLTKSTLYDLQRVPTPRAASNTPGTSLLTKVQKEVPNIDLVPDDLNVDFCERMLTGYYADGGYVENVGIVCLNKQEKLSNVFLHLGQATKKNYGDLLAICLCCSVKKGDEQGADNRAQGYVQMV